MKVKHLQIGALCRFYLPHLRKDKRCLYLGHHEFFVANTEKHHDHMRILKSDHPAWLDYDCYLSYQKTFSMDPTYALLDKDLNGIMKNEVLKELAKNLEATMVLPPKQSKAIRERILEHLKKEKP